MPEYEEMTTAQKVIHHATQDEPTRAADVISKHMGAEAMKGIEAQKAEIGANILMGPADGDQE